MIPRLFTRWSRLAVLALAICAAASCAQAHELPENRATFVMRDDNHVTATLYLNLPEVLRRALSPQRSFAEFVLVYSAMDPVKFKESVDEAELRMLKSMEITDGTGRSPVAERWEWPKVNETRAELQNLAAQLLVAPNEPPHDDPAEVHGDLVTSRATAVIKAKFPSEFDRVLAVSYRPKQVWVETGHESPDIRF